MTRTKRSSSLIFAGLLTTALSLMTLTSAPVSASAAPSSVIQPGEICFKGKPCFTLPGNQFSLGDIIGVDPSDGGLFLCTEMGLTAPVTSNLRPTGENVVSQITPPERYRLTPSQLSYVLENYKVSSDDVPASYALGILAHLHYENPAHTLYGLNAQQRSDRMASQLASGAYASGSSKAAANAAKVDEIVKAARANTVTSFKLGEIKYEKGISAKMDPITLKAGSNSFPGEARLSISGPGIFKENQGKTLTVRDGAQPEIQFTGTGTVNVTSSVKVHDPIVMKRYVPITNAKKLQSGVKAFPQSHTENASVSIEAIFPVVLGVEKSMTYTVGTDTKQLVPNEDANNVTDLSATMFGLFYNGEQVQWEDGNFVLTEPEDFVTRLSYDENGKTPAKYADAQGNPIDSRPTSGPIQGFANKAGKLYFVNPIAGKDYEVRELKSPAYTSDTSKVTKFETSKLRPNRNNASQVGVYERFNGEESHADFNAEEDLGMINEFDKFSFDAKKYYTLNGHKFSDPSQVKINNEKNPYSEVVLQIEKADGTPLTWNDNQMYFIKKEPSKYVKKGAFASTTGNVQVKLDANGEAEVEGILSLDEKSYKLNEVKTSDRSHSMNDPLVLNAKEHTSISSDPYLNNGLDFANVKLVKKGNYLTTKYDAHKALASFDGVEYGLFYGDGPHKDQPVMTNDYVVEASKALTASQPGNMRDTPWMQDGQVRWTGEKNKPFEIRLSNVVWGSYYIQELKSGVGHHVDTNRYYFGDELADMPENGVFVDTKKETLDKDVEKVSSEHESIDDIRLVSSVLQKRQAHINTRSPFMKSEKPAWGGSKKPVYSFEDVDFTPSETPIGGTSLANNIYQLYYAKNFDDSESTLANTPVKWDDPAVKHMQVTAGTRATGFDGIALATDDKGFIGVKDVAFGAYYWKEVQTTPGLTLDPKEYFWGVGYASDEGFGQLGNYSGTTDKNAPYNVDAAIAQTQNEVSKADTSINWEWKNVFADNRNAGSTNNVLTFGFSSTKLAKNENVEDNGENGVKLTLTPINGTKGEPITTETFTQFIQDNSGKTKATRGYFEFRTVPYGQYKLTSDGTNSDHASEIVKLLEINPVIVDMHATGENYNDRGYEISFHLDANDDGLVDEGDPILSVFSSDDNTSVPNQSQINALKQEDTPSNDAEEFAWMRPGYKDVNSNGLENNNFISLEANLDSANFEVNDLPKDDGMKFKTTATNSEGGKTLPSNVETAKLDDKIEIIFNNPEKQTTLLEDETYTFQTRVVRTDDVTKQLSPNVCTSFEWKNQNAIDVKGIPVNTMGLHKKEVVVFERLYSGKIADCDKPDESTLIGRHEDPNDKGQTLRVKHDGKLKTTATNYIDESKHVAPDVNQQIKDEIDLTNANLMPCKVYSVSAHPVMPGKMEGDVVEFSNLPERLEEPVPTIDQNKQPAIALPFKSAKVIRDTSLAENTCAKEGEDIILRPNEFVFEKGMTSVSVLVDGIDLTDFKPRTKVVMFEKVEGDDIKPLIHSDINDGDQTVTIQPSLKTQLFNVNKDGKLVKEYTPGEKLEFVDKVKARGVTANKVYTATLDLMTPTSDKGLDKKDGIEDGMTFYLDASGKPVTKTVDLDVKKNNVDYSIVVSFQANEQKQVIVAYETLVDKDNPDKKIEHKNPKDKEQTVTPKDKPTDDTPKRGGLAKTGTELLALLSIAGLFLILGAGSLFVARKRNR